MPIISISLNENIIQELDKLQKFLGFSGRSEIVRASVRNLLLEEKRIDELSGVLHSVLLVIHDEKSDQEIIECAKDRDSFSQNSLNNYALSDKIENNDNKDNDGKTDNKHSKEISECFDRAFGIDNYLSDSEIIECAKDRDSFK